MKRIFAFTILCSLFIFAKAQEANYSIEHEYHKVGVLNPAWEIDGSLIPNKYEHITGYYRDNLARIILKAVKENKVKIYDVRKRELPLDSVVNRVIAFEKKNFNHTLKKDSVWKFILPYVSEYSFEEFVNYNYKTLALEKKVKAYAPTLVRYHSFSEDKIDTVKMELFWVFPESELTQLPQSKEKKGKSQPQEIFSITDTIISRQPLKYPEQNPYVSSMFAKAKAKEACIYKADGSRFAAPKEVDKLFVEMKSVFVTNEETGQEQKVETSSDILPEDIKTLKIGELWNINTATLEINKKVLYEIPLLYNEDRNIYFPLGIRVQ